MVKSIYSIYFLCSIHVLKIKFQFYLSGVGLMNGIKKKKLWAVFDHSHTHVINWATTAAVHSPLKKVIKNMKNNLRLPSCSTRVSRVCQSCSFSFHLMRPIDPVHPCVEPNKHPQPRIKLQPFKYLK